MALLLPTVSASMPKNKIEAVTWASGDYLQRSSALTSVTNRKIGVASMWYRARASDTFNHHIFNWSTGTTQGATRSLLGQISNRLWVLDLRSTSNTSAGYIISKANMAHADTNWHHYLCAWDTSDVNKMLLYIDDVDQVDTRGASNLDVGYNTQYTRFAYWSSDQPRYLDGDLAEFYLNTDAWIDISVEANRRKFLSASKKPMWLGTQGQLPTGSQPVVYFSGVASVWNNGTNKGYGGNYTWGAGGVDDSSNEPVDA